MPILSIHSPVRRRSSAALPQPASSRLTRRIEPWAAGCLVAIAFVLGLSGLVAVDPLPALDLEIHRIAETHATPAVVSVSRALTVGGTWKILLPLGLLLLVAPHMRPRAWLWGLTLAGAPLVADLWQPLVARPRPAGHALGFPSGHATAAAAFAVVAIHALGDPRLAPTFRRALRAAVVLLAIGVGVTRVLLGAHWSTDVLVGFALGAGAGTGAVWWDKRRRGRTDTPSSTVRRTLLGLGLTVAAAALAACERTPGPPAEARLTVAASFYPLYEFSRQVAGDRADVITLVPPGVEPHDWEPSPGAIVDLRKARVIVYNGAGLEPWVGRLLQDAAPGTIAVNTTDGMALLAPAEADHDHAAAQGRGGAGAPAAADPHVWLDPLLALGQVQSIRSALERADPAGASAFRANAEAFAGRLRELDGRYAAGLRDCARRELVTAHAAFAYLARRYALVQMPVLGVSPDTEPNPRDLARLIQLARRHQVRYVFAETLLGRRLTETLAREVGASVLILNPIEGLTPEEQAAGKHYLSVMDDNLQALRTGLGCR